MFLPENWLGVLSLFSKYHEMLGFERIVKIRRRFPNIIAIKNGSEVKVEIEYNLIKFKEDYRWDKSGGGKSWFWDEGYSLWKNSWNLPKVSLIITKISNGFETTKEEQDYLNNQRKLEREDLENVKKHAKKNEIQSFDGRSELTLRIVSDPNNYLKINKYNHLVYKTLKPFCDYVVCWIVGDTIIEDDIEIIDLKKFLRSERLI